MSVCADGQGICMKNKNNQPSSSSVSRNEGLVCFPPLNQSFTICWACWQLPSGAEGLRDMTCAPGYHDRASRITTTTTKSSFKSVLKAASWDLHGNEGENRTFQVPEMMDKPWSSRKEESDSGYSISQDRRVQHTADVWKTLWFFREGNKCKALEDCRGEAHVKTWEKPSIPRILPEFSRQCWADGLSSTRCLKQGQRPFPVVDPQSDEQQSINATNWEGWCCILK